MSLSWSSSPVQIISQRLCVYAANLYHGGFNLSEGSDCHFLKQILKTNRQIREGRNQNNFAGSKSTPSSFGLDFKNSNWYVITQPFSSYNRKNLNHRCPSFAINLAFYAPFPTRFLPGVTNLYEEVPTAFTLFRDK